MGQVIRVWVDLLCSDCYRVLEAELLASDYDKRLQKMDETMFCQDCDDFVFPIVVMKREYDTRLATSMSHQVIQRDIEHGVEIVHIGGQGINKNLEPLPTGSRNRTIYTPWRQ